MLSAKTCSTISQDIQNYWDAHISELDAQLQGKERGHKIADVIDEKTTAHLYAEYDSAYERKKSSGDPKPRSMGDIWIKDQGVYHPVNIKTGIKGSEGQPNMVSMHKLLNAILSNSIDSYYLLMVKIKEKSVTDKTSASIIFVDMLNIIDYITYDAGPGQIMLKAKAFFDKIGREGTAFQNGLTIKEKVEKLAALMRDGESRLVSNRKKRLEVIEKNITSYLDNTPFVVSVDNQARFNLA